MPKTTKPKLEVWEKQQLTTNIVQYLITRDSIWTAKAARATTASLLKAIWTDVQIRTIETKYTEFSPRVAANLIKMPNLWEQVKWYFE